MLSKVKTLSGYKVISLDGEIGGVREFYFDDEQWTLRYLVANTGNWLTGPQVLISPHAITAVNPYTEHVEINLTRKQIEDSPSADADQPISREYESIYSGYFGYPAYWLGPYTWGMYPYSGGAFAFMPRPEIGPGDPSEQEEQGNYHLRSTNDVTGHHVQASDGEIGHVDDFIIEDKTWAIRYLVVDTVNWWPGKKVLVSPQWITGVSWEESKVFVDLTREAIRQSPEYTDDSPLTRHYEDAVYRHYDRQRYWVDDPSSTHSVR